ncbi:murein biosynthesis integral membrane protein MurJ, partial [Candidatus Microgenomates bacterium]|nr:murein biosynthesis integral membrane protein MurJ [Candidatus Microgenomates bacterium]
MNKIFNGTKNLILSRQRSLFTSTLIVAAMIILSKVFGFMRYRILAGYFNKEELDIYFASFRIPDLIFEILITGALTSSFVPIFIKYQRDKKALSQNISSIINLIFIAMTIFIFILFVGADYIIPFITPGFTGHKIETIILYSRILLVAQLPFLVLSNILTGVGQASKTFVISSLAPIVYNLAIIITTVWLAGRFHLLSTMIGVVIGAVIMFLMQLPLLYHSDFHYQPVLKITKGLKEFFHTMGPRITTVLAAQIDATIDLTLTTLLGSGSYTIFYLAQHLQLLPVSIVGIAFGQASLPYLSEVYQSEKMDEFKHLITQSLLNILFYTAPIASFFIFARTPVVRLLFGGEKFDWNATVLTAQTLTYFAFAIPIHSTYYFVTRCFYAFLDSKTPFIVSVISIVINALLSMYFIFILKLPVWSLSISFAVAMFFNVLVLLIILSKRIVALEYQLLVKETIKILIVTFIASFFAYWGMKLLDGLVLDTSRTINI